MDKTNRFITEGFARLKFLYFLSIIILCFISFGLGIIFSSSPAEGIVCLDSACVGCHVLGTAINISLTHPNVLVGCITCHSPECLPGLHKDTIRQLDPLYYNYTGTATNVGCNVCHGAPPQAVCVGGLVKDHCLDPAGCNPAIFDCTACHPNFVVLPLIGTSSHIYPEIGLLPFAPIASIAKCMYCHGLSLLVGRSGAHTKHFLTKLMAPTTVGTGVTIGCNVCHPDLTINLGADHLTCIPGTSNAWLPGKVPVIFNTLLPMIGVGDAYILGPLGGTGSCIIYCHSNGQTPPTTLLTAPLGYPGSALPLPWNVPFPIDPLILDCGCCHAYPPLTHTASKTTCNQCHPTPVLGLAPTSTYHINGNVDLWKYLAAASPMVPLTLPSSTPTSTSPGNLTLGSGLGLNNLLGLAQLSSTNSNFFNPSMVLLSGLGMMNYFSNPILAAPFSNNISLNSLSITDESSNPYYGLNYTNSLWSGYNFNPFGFRGLSLGLGSGLGLGLNTGLNSGLGFFNGFNNFNPWNSGNTPMLGTPFNPGYSLGITPYGSAYGFPLGGPWLNMML